MQLVRLQNMERKNRPWARSLSEWHGERQHSPLFFLGRTPPRPPMRTSEGAEKDFANFDTTAGCSPPVLAVLPPAHPALILLFGASSRARALPTSVPALRCA